MHICSVGVIMHMVMTGKGEAERPIGHNIQFIDSINIETK